ncbi:MULTISPECIES: aldose epimerase family protein [Nostocales]|uniref:Aldose epimerase n=3 Tax=Nostocales TaxID=1161 RepID=A0A0C1QUN1_9CYAN|nr:aldose epimerase [Tolypothrix bouteillei]KAF3885042.1 aldose epimerase [Tolypothrix bouteillei VB521301]
MNKRYIQTNQSRLEVVPERGGIIIGWRVEGQDILYLDEERFANPELSVRGGVPILFPICGNLPDNLYTYNGQEYTLKQHGFARDLPWSVVGEEVSQDKATLAIALSSNEQTRAHYPFEFQIVFTYKIEGHTLEIRQEYKNLSSEAMPFSIGFHPYFVTSDKTQLEFEIPSNQYQDQITKEVHSFNGTFDYNADVIDVAFKHLNGKLATVSDRSRKLKLEMEYDEIYSTLVFWTVKGKDFYCLEPWSAPRNALNTGESLTVLEPNTSYSANVRLKINFL